MNPALFVVATPIGNRADLSPRAVEVLSSVQLIAAEDTRKTGQLLADLGIGKKELISYYDQVEGQRAPVIIDRMLAANEQVALVSDAGTPCISDPGYRLIALAHEKGVKVIPVPGVSALTTLVSSSGLPSQKFFFVGFLPQKEKALQQEIESWLPNLGAVVFYESLRRLARTLAFLQRFHPNCQVTVGRELTKTYEEIKSLAISQAINWCSEHPALKGEVVVMVAGLGQSESQGLELNQLRERLAAELTAGHHVKEILKNYKNCGLSRRELYQLLLEIKGNL